MTEWDLLTSWIPASHHMFPVGFKIAVKTVLLAVSKASQHRVTGDVCYVVVIDCMPDSRCRADFQIHLHILSTVYAAGEAKPSGLQTLPWELVAHILSFAALPLTSWLSIADVAPNTLPDEEATFMFPVLGTSTDMS